MTKKLEETFNIKPIDDEGDEVEETPSVEESKELTEILNTELETIDKIDSALPMVQDLNQHDREMDEIHSKALNAFEELFSLFSDGKIDPTPSDRFSLENSADAIAHLKDRKAKGKVIVSIN